MQFDRDLQKRSGNTCELCQSAEDCFAYAIPHSPVKDISAYLWLCATCQSRLDKPDTADANHWRLLNESIWSEVPGVKVISWRMLHRLNQLDWARDLLEMAYLDDDQLDWAKASGEGTKTEDGVVHLDCNGAVLQDGDSVVLIKTLDVKGATFSAKMGTVVKKIRLVEDNSEQIEGRVNGSQIVILTKYLRKASSWVFASRGIAFNIRLRQINFPIAACLFGKNMKQMNDK